MQEIIFKLSNTLEFQFRKKGLHTLHSPYVYDFASRVIKGEKHHHSFEVIRKARGIMLSNRNVIETVDFGTSAGNSEFKTYRIRVNQLAKKRTGSLKDMMLLNRAARYMKAEHILEFGTSTGLSSVALATAHPQVKLITMEGCASLAAVAQSLFDRLNLKNIELEIGNFNIILPSILENVPKLDMVFFDGNHRKLPTLNYFHHCLTKAHSDSIFVFDDIRWSSEMYEAWQEISSSEQVSISIELFKFGIVLFRSGIEKQHFMLS